MFDEKFNKKHILLPLVLSFLSHWDCCKVKLVLGVDGARKQLLQDTIRA